MTAYTIAKTQSAQPAGPYVRTVADDYRDAADILVTGYAKREKTEIRTKRKLSGAGIKLLRTIDGRATYLVSEEVMTELRRRFSVATDF